MQGAVAAYRKAIDKAARAMIELGVPLREGQGFEDARRARNTVEKAAAAASARTQTRGFVGGGSAPSDRDAHQSAEGARPSAV